MGFKKRSDVRLSLLGHIKQDLNPVFILSKKEDNEKRISKNIKNRPFNGLF
jgi:hypothetical protein